MKPTPVWLFLTVPVLVLALWLLARTVRSLLRVTRGATVLSVPLTPLQTVSFREPGSLDLFLEGRRGANLSGLEFELRDPGGSLVDIESAVFRTTVSGLSRVRVKVRTVHLERDGVFTLSISGLRAGMDTGNRVIFARPIGSALMGHILGMVGLGFLIIGSLAGSILLLIPRR